jgi:hypothetical protein
MKKEKTDNIIQMITLARIILGGPCFSFTLENCFLVNVIFCTVEVV